MTFRYSQSTGVLTINSAIVGTCYAGRNAGLDNHAMEGAQGTGPIPCGFYTIGDPQEPVGHLGPLAMPLKPNAGTDTLGRSGFFMHGDNASHDHSASHGCIVADLTIRTAVLNAPDDQLEVVP